MLLSAAESSDVAVQAAAPTAARDGSGGFGEEEDGNSMTEQVHVTETI